MVTYRWRIFWVSLDAVAGSEQAGKRPALVVSPEEVNHSLPVVTVLPITSFKPGRKVYATESRLYDSGTQGLPPAIERGGAAVAAGGLTPGISFLATRLLRAARYGSALVFTGPDVASRQGCENPPAANHGEDNKRYPGAVQEPAGTGGG